MRKVLEGKDAGGGALSEHAPGFLFWVFQKKTVQRVGVFVLFAGIFIGLAHLYPIINIDPASDLGNYYYRFWVDLDTAEFGDIILRYEPGFVLIAWLVSLFISFSGFLWLLKFLLFYTAFLLLSRERRGVHAAALLAVLGLAYYLPLNSLATLVIRQGIATAVFFYFLAMHDLGTMRRRTAVAWVLLMITFHYSSVFVLVAMLLYFVMPGLRPFRLWLAMIALYCVNLSGQIGLFMYSLLGLNIDSLEALSTDLGIEYTVGFKFSFLLLSTFFVLVPLALSRFGILARRPAELLAHPWFQFYFLLNALATVFTLLPFHDRFFMWSWVLGPALLVSVLGDLRMLKARNEQT